METHPELSLPNMGCGTWSWGNQILWGYKESMDHQLQEVFNLCVSHGVTLFDTGDSYGTGRLNGRSELLLGKFSHEYQGIGQENICIATKLAAYPWRWTSQSMAIAGQASARRLGRKIDLVQMHWSTANYAPWLEGNLLDGLAYLYESGLVSGVGLSNYGPERLQWVYNRFKQRNIPISTLQVQYSLLSTYPFTQLGLKEVCDDLGIKLIAYSPLALGLLTGKFSQTGNLPPGIRGFLFKQLLPGIKPILGCLRIIADFRNKTMSQVAINWCMRKGTIPIPGAKNVEQAKDNIGALGWELSDAEVTELDQVANKVDKKMVQNIFQTK